MTVATDVPGSTRGVPEAGVPTILVIGGGAGGLPCAIELARATGQGRDARVVLIDPNPAHLWKPRLHEIAVGLLVAADEQAHYAEQAKLHGFAFMRGAVEAVDAVERAVSIGAVTAPDGREVLPRRRIGFDRAVLAIGSTVDDFAIPGVFEHCEMLDTPQGAERLHAEIFAHAARVSAGYAGRVAIAIVGAGTTGVELAADLRSAAERLPQYRSLIGADQLAVTLVEMADRPLPGVSTDSSAYARRLLEAHGVATRFGARVARVEAGCLHLADGSRIAADILVWASGVRGRSVAVTPPPWIESGGRMRVDDRLRLIDREGRVIDPLHAIGDCAANFVPGADRPVGATAQAAHQQAERLARSIAGQLRGRPPLVFRYRYRGTLVSLGAGAAVGDIPAGGVSFRIAGFSAKLAYRLLYRAHLRTLFGRVRTFKLVLAERLRRSARPSVKLHW